MTQPILFTPIRDSYSVVPTYPIRETLLEGGATRKYTDALYFPHEVSVSWRLTNAADYTNFMGFFRTTLLECTEYFLMDLVTDIGALIPHRCRTKNGMPRLTQVNGNSFYVSSVLEVEVNPTYTGLISYTGPDVITFTHTDPRLVGPVLPGDTIRIFNSEGVHPGNSIDWTFDGSDDVIEMGDVLDMTRITPRSIFVWYSTVEDGVIMVSKQAGASTPGWRFAVSEVDYGDLILSGSGGAQQIQVGMTTRPPIDGTEHFFGFTYTGSSDAAGVKIYLDGEEGLKSEGQDNLTSADITNTTSLKIGRRESSGTAFPGTLRHVSIWNRVLTAPEVEELYDGGSPPNLAGLSFFSDCIGWWKIDPTDTAATGGVIDHSASGNDGSALNGLGDTVLTGEVEVNLDGIYEVDTVTPNNQITLVSPELVNPDWDLLGSLGSYGAEGQGNVISTLTRYPRDT